MAAKWKASYLELAKDFSPLTDEGGKPALLGALDDNLEALLAAHIVNGESGVNKRYVEDLLSDCAARISNCMSLRERAHDVEVRAIDAAMTAQLQASALSLARNVNAELKTIQHKMGATALRETHTGQTVEYEGDAAIWQNVNALQETFYEVQKTQLDDLKIKASTPGNGANFVERFDLLKRLFDLGIVEAYGRCVACAAALKSIYGIIRPVPPVRPTTYLNDLAVWAQNASDDLDVELSGRYSGEVCFAVAGIDDNLKDNELVPRTKFTQSVATDVLNFALTEAHFTRLRMKSVLLRSARVQIKTKSDSATRTRLWSGTLQMPSSDLTPGDEIFPCIASTGYPDAAGEFIIGCHNLQPVGDWALRLSDRSITGDATAAEVENVYLYVQVSYKR